MFFPKIAQPPFPFSVHSLSVLSHVICFKAVRAHILYTKCMPVLTTPSSFLCLLRFPVWKPLSRTRDGNFAFLITVQSATTEEISTSLSLLDTFTLCSSINTKNLHKVDLTLSSALRFYISGFLAVLENILNCYKFSLEIPHYSYGFNLKILTCRRDIPHLK